MDKYSFLNAASTAYFGDLYDKYLENPDAIEPSWRAFFQGFDFAQEQYGASVEEVVPMMVQQVVANEGTGLSEKVEREFKVLNQRISHLWTLVYSMQSVGSARTSYTYLRHRKLWTFSS